MMTGHSACLTQNSLTVPTKTLQAAITEKSDSVQVNFLRIFKERDKFDEHDIAIHVTATTNVGSKTKKITLFNFVFLEIKLPCKLNDCIYEQSFNNSVTKQHPVKSYN